MHHAPSVALPVGRSLAALRLSLMVWLGGWAVLGLWWASAEPSPVRLLLLAVVQLGAGWIGWRCWRAAPTGRLLWDAGQWQWEPCAGQPITLVAPSVVLDFQSLVLVRTRTAGDVPGSAVPAALWLERRVAAAGAGADERWQSLRRAVYSRATPSEPPLQPDRATPLP